MTLYINDEKISINDVKIVSSISWNLAADKLPENNHEVIIYLLHNTGHWLFTKAVYIRKFTVEEYTDGDDICEYNEADGKYYYPEGWYEVCHFTRYYDLYKIMDRDTETVLWAEMKLPDVIPNVN